MKKQWTLASILALSLAVAPTVLASGAVDKAQQNMVVPKNTMAMSVAVSSLTDVAPVSQVDNAVHNERVLAAVENAVKAVDVKVNTTDEEAAGEEKVELKTLTIEEALKLAEENNTNLQLAKFERQKKRAAAQQAISTRRDIPDFLDRSKLKAEASLNEDQKKAELAVADRKYEVAKVQIELLIKKNYYDVLKAEDLKIVRQSALERAEEQLRQAQVAFQVGTVAKNDVLGAEAAVSAAKATLTATENQHRLAEINLSRSIGLETKTRYKLSNTVQHEQMGKIDLDKVINDAQENRLDVMEKSSSKDLAELYYDIVAGYSAPYTYDAKQAKAAAEQAALILGDTRKGVVSDITSAYLNVQAAEKQLLAFTDAAESSKEALRLAKLRYEVGMATSLDVLSASASLEEMEANRVKALYDYNLAVLSFETCRLAPLS